MLQRRGAFWTPEDIPEKELPKEPVLLLLSMDGHERARPLYMIKFRPMEA